MTTTIAPETTWQVAPEGRGGFQCSTCGYYLTKRESSHLASRHDAKCARCGNTITTYSANLYVTAESARHLDKDNVRGDLWYHATKSSDWMADLIAGEEDDRDFIVQMEGDADLDTTLMVHVGTEDAALDRTQFFEGSVYMYVLRLKDGVDIADEVKEDENGDCPCHAAFCAESGYSTEVTRYVNLYESPGSISLLVNRKCIEIVESFQIQ